MSRSGSVASPDFAPSSEASAGLVRVGSADIWARGGLTVKKLQREFADPAWRHRGRYRAIKQFIMNWNNWPSREDRAAMLDGPPPKNAPLSEKARIAAVVHCLCERDRHPLPRWVRRFRGRCDGVMLLSEDRTVVDASSPVSRFEEIVRAETPAVAQSYGVWFEASLLNAR